MTWLVIELLEQVAKLKRAWNLVIFLQIVQKISGKYFPCLYLSIDQVWWVNELRFQCIFRNQKCTLSRVLILIMKLYSSWRHRFSKSWDSWKYKNLKISKTEISFPWNKKILNLCLRWHILKSYHFVAEVTFNLNQSLLTFLLYVGQTWMTHLTHAISLLGVIFL